MRNDLYFDENEFYEEIQGIVKKAFLTDSNGEKTDYWYNLCDKKRVKLIDNYSEEIKIFPSVVITLDDNYVYSQTSDSEQINNHTRLLLRINIYTKSNSKYTAQYLANALSQRIIQAIQMAIGLECNTNQRIPYLDKEVYRKLLSFEGIIDNKTKVYFR